MSKVYVSNEYGGPENQELITRNTPQPGPGELGVKVHAAGVNPLDWKVRSGVAGTPRELPAPLGEEASGIVTAVGDGVEGFAVGDPVLGLVAPGVGGYAEDTLLVAESTVLKPEEISFTDAAAIPVAGASAYAGTHQVELEPGQSLLINGAGGGVGLMAAQIGRVHKFQVVGVDHEDKRELIESTGAIFVATGDAVAEQVRALLPDGVDVVFDLVGGEALRVVAPLAKNPAHVISAADAAPWENSVDRCCAAPRKWSDRSPGWSSTGWSTRRSIRPTRWNRPVRPWPTLSRATPAARSSSSSSPPRTNQTTR